MRRSIRAHLRPLSTTLRPYTNGGSHPKPPKSLLTPFSISFSTNSRSPPQWVEPFTALSDTASASRNLQPSPRVNQILALLDGSPKMEANLDQFCRKMTIKLSPSFVSFVLRSAELRQNPDASLRFFSWAGKQKKYSHNLECYVNLIQLLASNGDLGRVKGVIFELKQMGFVMTVSGTNSLIRSFGGLGMVEELLWVWCKMKETRIEPSVYTYNFLVNGLVNAMSLESAEEVFEVMQGGNVGPDVVTYNTMIKGYCKAGNTRKAMEKFRDMEIRNVEPDKITYMTLMQGCYSDGGFDSCLALYLEMEEKGLEVPPHAYSLVIGGLCKEGKCAVGYAVYESMIQKGCKVNVAIYTALIDSFAKSGNMEEAMKLVGRMKNDGLKADVVTCGVIVNGLCKSGRLDEAMEFFKLCKENGEVVNAVFYSSLIDGLGKAGRIGEAKKLFEEMAEKGCTRDSYCYNVLIDALAKCGKIDEALALFDRMDDEDCDQTVYTYTILISGLFRECRNEEALMLWDAMIDKGITPTAAACRALSIGLCLSGKVVRAFKKLDEIAPMGVIIETEFEDMINVLCKAGRVKEACKFGDRIVDRGREIPERVRTVLVNALRKAGNSELAMKLMHSNIGVGYYRTGSVETRVKFRHLVES